VRRAAAIQDANAARFQRPDNALAERTARFHLNAQVGRCHV
jgi:hypothetical protein